MNKILFFLLKRPTVKTLIFLALFSAIQEKAKAQVVNGLPNVIAHISFDSAATSTIQYPKAFSFKSNRYKYTTNRFGLKGSASEKSAIVLDSINTEFILDSCTISFWYKSNRKDESIINLNLPNTFNLKVYTKAGNVYAERTENLNKKWSYVRVCNKIMNVSDNEWHQITIRFAALSVLILNVDMSETVQKLQLLSKKDRLNLTQDLYGYTERLYGFDTDKKFNINYDYAAIDDVFISSGVFTSNLVQDNYNAANYANRLKEIARAKELELKRLEDLKFTTRTKVVNYLSNKSFVYTEGNEKFEMSFDENAQNLFQTNRVALKLSSVTILSDYRAELDYYDYDPRLAITIEVNAKSNTVRRAGAIRDGAYTGLYKLDEKLQSAAVNGWKKKGVYKVEMRNPQTGSYDEIMMTNPGKFIELRNDKDLRISDNDLFSLIFGKEYLLFYNYAEFINGQRYESSLAQTSSYKGNIELKNNEGTNARSGDARVHFMYGSGKRLVEIVNDICKCYIRLYYSDQVGLRIVQ